MNDHILDLHLQGKRQRIVSARTRRKATISGRHYSRDVSDVVFPPGFFDRMDPTPDLQFYRPPRLVTHIDDRAIAAVGSLYAELAVDGEVLDLMTSWVSHFRTAPHRLVGLGMNAAELQANPMLAEHVVHDLNAHPILPFADESFDDVTCCVSVDYLIHPVTVFREVARVLRPSGRFVLTFSNRCFPTKAIQGWLDTDDEQHVQIVAAYFAGSAAFGPVRAQLRTPPGPGDPLYAVWAPRLPAPSTSSLTSASVPVRPDPTRAHSRSQHFRFSER